MKYLVDNPTAKPSDVAKACKCSIKYVYNIRSKVGTPKEVFEQEARDKAYQHWSIEPVSL